MGSKAQLSANEAFDDFTSQQVGEGYVELRTSADNRLIFRSPAEANAYRLANAGQFSAGRNDGGFDTRDQADGSA